MRVLIVLALGLATAAGLFADAASKDAKIEQVLVMVKTSAMAAEDQAFAALGTQFDKVSQSLVLIANIPEPERKAAAADIVAKLTAAVREFGTWEKIKPAMAEAYRDTYSEEELDGLLAFFNSPIGQTYLSKSILIAAKVQELNEKRLKELTYIVEGITRDWMAEHRKAAPAK